MARTNEWTETLVDWVDGRLRQNRFSNMWLGGGAGADGGSSYRPIDGQLTQRHVCYDTSEDASPCSPSGFSSLVDNLRRIRYWQEPATWFGVTTSGAPPSGSSLNVYIKPGLWYPSTTEYCAFPGGHSPTFTLPGVLDRIDTVYIDPSGILHIQRGTPAVSPTITLPPIASGIPLWAVHLTPTASGITFIECSGYYSGMGYIERDLRPFLNLGGGGAVASGVLPASNRGAILRGGVADWETYNVGAANEVLTNDGTDVIWSTGAINLTAGKTLVVSVNLTLTGVDGKLLTIEENSILNQDLTTDASVTFADVFVPDGGTFGISGNELLTVNAAGNFTFSGVTSIVVPDGAWVGADAACAWLFNSTSGFVTTQDTTGVGTAAPEGMLDVAYGGYTGKMTLLLGADLNAITRTNNTNKRTLMGSYHYINVEQPVAMMYAFSSSIVSRLDIGGGHIYCNAATEVSIYTAADTTTVTGTKRFSIDSTGAITVTGPSLEVPDGWWLGIGAAAERIVIDSAGDIAVMEAKFGIGTVAPNELLHIKSATGHAKIEIESTTDNATIFINAPADEFAYVSFETLGVEDWEIVRPANQTYLEIKSSAINLVIVFAKATGNVGIGIIPNQKLTVEGTIDLKEQAAANADVASYGQIWVKNTAPNELWFTDDDGTDVQLGLGGGLPNVAGAGYALVSDGVNSWAVDQTPAWTGEHSFMAGIAFTGASGANEITVPDNTAIALELLDAGGLEYMRVVSTNANPYLLIDPAGAGIHIGIGAGGDGDKKLYFYENIAALAGTKYGVHIKLEAAPAANSACTHYGMWVQAEMTTNFNVNNITAMTFHATHSGTGTTATACGVIGKANIADTIAGTITNSYGGFFFTDIEDGSGTISAGLLAYTPFVDTGSLGTGYGLRIRQGTVGAGSITTLYGVYIEAINAGGTNYAVYSAGGDCYLAGNTGIGAVPTYRLHVEQDTAGYVAYFFNDGDNVNRHLLRLQGGADNGAAVGTTIYIYALDGNGGGTGTIKTIDGVFQLADISDGRRKTNIVNTKLNGLDIINGLRVRDYNWKANPDGPVMTSFVAQEAQKVYPAMVSELGSDDDTLGTSRAMLIPILTKAIQELDARLTCIETH